MSYCDIAKKLAYRFHAEQFRRDGTTPYIAHPAAVVQKLSGESDEVLATAWLHDILEDTPATINDLHNAGFSDTICKAVQLLTKRENTNYITYINAIRSNEIARKVKIADIMHNLSDAPSAKQKQKYADALNILMCELH